MSCCCRVFLLGMCLSCLFWPHAAMAINLLDVNNAYDYVIVSHDSLISQADRLRSHRGAQLRACVVKTSEIDATFSGLTMVDKIRAFVVYAYEHWKIVPTYVVLLGDANDANPLYDLVPTAMRYNPFSPACNENHYFADDGYFVDPVSPGESKPIAHVGRIPARSVAEAEHAVDKIIAYDQITGAPAWLERILMTVGDANIGGLNGVYKQINDQLRTQECAEWSAGSLQTLYSSEHPYLGGDGETCLRNAWNTGYGFVNALGNDISLPWTCFCDNFVLLANFHLPPAAPPTFTEGLDGTLYLPVVFGATCLINQFGRDWESSIGEDLLLKAPDRGAVAVVGASHVTDLVEAYDVNRAFVHALLHDGVRNVGRLLSLAKARLLADGSGHAEMIRQILLLGDPATDVKLGSLPIPTSFASGFEIEDPPALQCRLLESTPGVQNLSTRVVHTDVGVNPLSSRMLRASATVPAGCSGRFEWRIQELDLELEPNMILSFWINVPESPGGTDQIVIDGNTTMGRIGQNSWVVDQNGVGLNASSRSQLPTGWQYVYADVSAMAGATLTDLRLGYKNYSYAWGSLRAYVDDIRVERSVLGGGELDRVVNGSFEEDVDGNETPDFWTNVQGNAQTDGVQRSDGLRWDGDWSMMVFDEFGQGEGAQQVIFVSEDVPEYLYSFQHRAPDSTGFRVTVVDAGTGSVVADRLISSSDRWLRAMGGFVNPYYGVHPGRVKVRILPEVSANAVYIDDFHVYVGEICGVSGSGTPGSSGGLVQVVPNPASLSGQVQVRFRVPEASERVSLDVYSCSGRCETRIEMGALPEGVVGLMWEPVSGTRVLSPGLYFLKLRTNGEILPGGLKIVLLP